MSDKLYILFLTKEEAAYLISLCSNLQESINNIPNFKYRKENLQYINSILNKIDKCRK